MFNENYYIDYIRKYISPATHSVSWINANWESIIIDGEDTPMGNPIYIAPQVENFNKEGINSNFYLKNNNFPTSADWNEPFSSNGIDALFYTQNQNFPAPVEWIKELDYNQIFSNFSQRYGEFVQADTAEWIAPWSVDGIYTNFYVDLKYFHGFPAGVLTVWQDNLSPEWLPYTPKDSNKEISFSGKITIDEKTETITSTILDRDIHKEQYKDYINDYWQRRDSNATNS